MMHTPDPQDFRQAMSRLGAAVNIITTDGPCGRHGLTASAVCSVTDQPPTLLVCINRAASTHEILLGNGAFCVNVLGHAHAALAQQFGRPGTSPEARFAHAAWAPLVTGAPALEGASVALDCRISGITRAGTHSVILGEVQALRLDPGRPGGLVYFNRDFHCLGAAPAA